MRRFSAILLTLAVAALGSGALRYVHELEHMARDAHASEAAGHSDHDAPAAPADDDANCFVHAKLNLPMLGGGYLPVLVCLGLFVAFLTLLSVPVRSRRPMLRLDCRGPPVRPLLQFA